MSTKKNFAREASGAGQSRAWVPVDFIFYAPVHPWWLACYKSFKKVIRPDCNLGKKYANLQAVVKICQIFISNLLTISDSSNQIMIPDSCIFWYPGKAASIEYPQAPLLLLLPKTILVLLAKLFFLPLLVSSLQAMLLHPNFLLSLLW